MKLMIIKNLRYSREIFGLKQRDVAKALGVHFSTYSNWENGYDTIPLRKLILYANSYKFSLDYLFGITRFNNFEYIDLDIKVVSKNLKTIRKERNKTQNYVATKVNISNGSYCEYENGKKLITTSSLYGLYLVYKDISFDNIFK